MFIPIKRTKAEFIATIINESKIKRHKFSAFFSGRIKTIRQERRKTKKHGTRVFIKNICKEREYFLPKSKEHETTGNKSLET